MPQHIELAALDVELDVVGPDARPQIIEPRRLDRLCSNDVEIASGVLAADCREQVDQRGIGLDQRRAARIAGLMKNRGLSRPKQVRQIAIGSAARLELGAFLGLGFEPRDLSEAIGDERA